ncbi:MAG: peptide-methionine (R)-S-oxide reductase MsrB [Bacteroidota bacterium]|jgi:peptide-methionine (R)-S-oxide reductase
MSTDQPHHYDEQALKAKLTPIAYAVLRNGATEPPFSGVYNDHFESGNYHCMACGSLLFEGTHKFESGCGWPAFDRAVPGAITYLRDTSHGMIRTETRCAQCDSHLGHVFDDGPRHTTKKRYCINSVCLDFKPRK